MKKTLLLAMFGLFAFVGTQAQRVCGTMEHYEYQRALNPAIEQRQNDIENFTNEFIQRGGGAEGERALVTIPVVVHVVWNTATENISDAQVLSQIAVLNADFRKMNSDVNLTPSVFQPLAADANIEFCLATVDPTGAATTGITRTQTSTTAFSTNDAMKFTAQGGKDAWDASKYLNIWVCDISGGILGYAQFPGGAASTDGVVIDYQYYGTTGTATAPFNKGRTATHEVGHWLNLRHIWGDANCGNDLVADTPTQQTSNYGCPTFPHTTCSNGANGDMFMNYMDYVDDACMYMFSNGQAARMQALFAQGGARASLLNSTACGTANTTCAAPTALTTSAISGTGATLSWTAASGSTGYNLSYKQSTATTWTTVSTTATSYTLTGLTSCTNYDWSVQSVCDATNSSAVISAASFITTGCVATYCASNGQSTADEFINNVTVGGINNTSGNNAGYANFTALTANLATNGTYTFSGTPGYTATAYSEFWRVWIDYNQDLDFLDAGEQVFGSTAGSTTTVSGSFTVPATALLGNTRMRVSMKYNAASTSCESFQFGEVEDYTVNISQGVSCGTPTGLAVASITQTGAVASWTALSGATSYSVQYKLNSATTWTTVSSATTSYTLSGLTAGTAYNVRVAAVCSGTTGAYSAQVNFTTTASTPACTDNYESNNTLNTAKTIVANTNITARISTSTDKDYFKFTTTTAARNIRIDLTGLPADYDVRLYNPSNTQVGISQNTGLTSEAITYNNGATGTYKVYVYGYNGAFNATSCYTLRASTSATAFREGGEEEVALIEEGTQELGSISAYPNPTDGKVIVSFDATEDATLNLQVFDITGREVYGSKLAVTAGYNATMIDLQNVAPGYYTVLLNDGKNRSTVSIVKK